MGGPNGFHPGILNGGSPEGGAMIFAKSLGLKSGIGRGKNTVEVFPFSVTIDVMMVVPQPVGSGIASVGCPGAPVTAGVAVRCMPMGTGSMGKPSVLVAVGMVYMDR